MCKKDRDANVWSDARARKSGAARSLFIHDYEQQIMAQRINSEQAAANAELARAFADIFTNRLRFVSAAHMGINKKGDAGNALS